MAKPFCCSSFSLIFFIFLLQTQFSNQLEDSQLQAFLIIRQILNFPPSLTSSAQNTDFCSIEPSPYLTVVCYEENITQIHTRGLQVFAPVSGNFSMETLFSALAGLPGLRVLSLVSLGLWGTIPQTISNLTSLEMINFSSNNLSGTIPYEMLALKNLQTVVLDHNRFHGKIPSRIGSLSGLIVLSLKNNTLSGSLPVSLSNLTNLRILQLSMNQLSGEVPDFGNLTNLQVLDLGNNSFGPKFPVLHNKLVTLVLRKNKFRLVKFENLSSFYQLQKLDLYSNEFVGPFPSFLLSLPLIGYFNIAKNRFHGTLPEDITCGAELNFVDLSYNLLTGDLPPCLKRANESRTIKYKGNCLLNEGQKQRSYSYCHDEALAVKILPQRQDGKQSHSKIVVAMSIVGGTSLTGLLVLGIGIVFSRQAFKKPRTRVILEKATTVYPTRLFADAREICQMAKLGPLGLPAYRNFLLDEIKEATANFDKSNLIGEGSYGPVYKGTFANDDLVAIRSLKMRKRRGTQAYTQHVELLSKLRHTHLVSALGHCYEYHREDSTVNKIHLVFEFISNGTLRDFISGKKPSWSQRITAATEVAKGIQFLQTGIHPGLYTNNLKITDVLLDQNLHLKLNSYNLPLLAENIDMVDDGLSSAGSKENGKAIAKKGDAKNDVYDFGVILMEILVGRPITSRNDISVTKDLFQVGITADKRGQMQVVDPTMCKMCSDHSLKIVMELCVRSLASEPNERPNIDDVLWNLQFAGHVQDSWQGDNSGERASPVFTSQ